MSNEMKFGTHCLLMALQITSAALNIFILSLFCRFSSLRNNKHLRLILFLTISDVLFAVCEGPFSIYMTINWNWDILNFDSRFMLISSIPLPSQLKISAILTISIALNRNIALIYPGMYLRMKHENYAIVTVIVSICFAVVDVFLYFSMSDFEPKPGCASSGCFVGDNFRYYWGISNMVLGCFILLLSTIIFFKINQQKNQMLRKSSNEAKFRQANRTSLGILGSSLAFLTIPSVFVGIFEMCGLSLFKQVGPFYVASLLSSEKILKKMANEIQLGIYYFMLTFQILGVVLNGFILSLFISISSLRSNKSLRLILFLTISDFLFALSELPFSAYVIDNWNSKMLNYDPLYILTLSTPLPAQLKISAILAISIALNRNAALIFPVSYLQLNQVTYASLTALIAFIFAVLDVILCFSLSELKTNPGCGAIGCFVGSDFRFYWGISNTILGSIVILLSTSIFLKLNQQKNTNSRSSTNEAKLRQANRISLGILVSSLAFFSIPSILVGVFNVFNLTISKLFGPFYLASLLINGVCNAIIFLANNGDARRIIARKSISSLMNNVE